MQDAVKHFQCSSVRGFSYTIPNGTIITEFPRLGIIMILKNTLRFYDGEQMQEIFKGQNQISVISLSGHMLAIGQKMFKGQLTNMTILDLKTKVQRKLKYQKTKMQSLSISLNHDYLSSIGSSDQQRQQFYIIDLTAQYQIGFKQIASQIVYKKQKNQLVMAEFSQNQNNLIAILYKNRFVLGYIQNDRLLQKTAKANKVRQFSMAIFDPYHQFVYLSSKNGDISQISIQNIKQNRIGPRKRVIISGIKHIRYILPDKIIITGVKGFIALLQMKQMRILKQVTIQTQIISLTNFINDLGFITTISGSIYVLNAQTLDIHPFYNSHNSKITDLAFSEGINQLFASCAGNQIVVWKTKNLSPLLKIKLKNAKCLCLQLPPDGKSIISGWNDDCVRFFNPVTGKQTKKITKANNSQVTALKLSANNEKLITGGKNGSIRVWSLDRERFGIIQQLFTGHRGSILTFFIQKQTLYSGSEDGCYGIWQLKNGNKLSMIRLGNFITQISPINNYQVMHIGSGPCIDICRKNDGQLTGQIKVSGSHLNAFEFIKEQLYNFYIFGGQESKIFIRKYYENKLNQNYTVQQFETSSEIVKMKVSPNSEYLIVGTLDGTIYSLKFEQEGVGRLNKKTRQQMMASLIKMSKNK